MVAATGLAFFGAPPELIGRDPVLRYPVPLGEASALAMALCGDAVAEIWRRRTGQDQMVRVPVRNAAAAIAGYAYQLLDPSPFARAEDWEPEAGGWRAWGARSLLAGMNASNPAVGIYRCRDGRWFHVHGGLPHLARRICDVLQTAPDGIPAAVGLWDSATLEDALAAAETCGVTVRSRAEWLSHPQGRRLAALPIVEVERIGDAAPLPLPAGAAPLSDLRVLDLTVALAGPTAARTLAQHGADVLHVSAPGRTDRQPFEIDTGHGKRSVFIDLKATGGRETLSRLVASTDVFIQGYRQGALTRLGFDASEVAARRPGIIYVSINCYGHTGPWAQRRGWEGLAQATTGLTVATGDGQPRLAPGSVCDYLTGYVAARGVLEALLRRSAEGGSWHVKASLCQTGMWLSGLAPVDEQLAPEDPDMFIDLLVETATPFGRLRHLPPTPLMSLTPPVWDRPPPLPGADPASWSTV
jgi:crotonobetainyl-CoA:carnitine CoA-transferase CaiB-like acyl-CoA transferase